MPFRFRRTEKPIDSGAGWYPARRLVTGASWTVYQGFGRAPARGHGRRRAEPKPLSGNTGPSCADTGPCRYDKHDVEPQLLERLGAGDESALNELSDRARGCRGGPETCSPAHPSFSKGTFGASNRSAISSAVCRTSMGEPSLSNPPRICIAQPGQSMATM